MISTLFALSISDLIIDVFRVSMITELRLLKQDIQMAGFFGNKALDSEINPTTQYLFRPHNSYSTSSVVSQ